MATPAENLVRVTDETPSAPESSTLATPAPPTRTSVTQEAMAAVQSAFAPAAEAPAPEQPAQTPEQAPPVEAPPADATITEAPAPVVEPPVAEPPPTQPSRGLARVYDVLDLPDKNAAIAQVQQAIIEDASYDPKAAHIAINAMFNAHQKTYQDWVLDDLKISKDKVSEFLSWANAGAPALPSPSTPPPFPEFPVPDSDGLVTIGGIVFDMNVPIQEQAARELYDDKKFIHEEKAAKQLREAERQKTQAEAEAQRQAEAKAAQERQVEGYVNAYKTERTTSLINGLAPIWPKFAVGDEWLGTMLESAIAGRLRMLEDAVDEHGQPAHELGKLSKQADEYVKANAGRKDELGREMDKLALAEARAMIDNLNRMVLRANKAEVALTARDPQVPTQVPTQTVVTPTDPRVNPPANTAEAKQRALDDVRRVFQNQPPN